MKYLRSAFLIFFGIFLYLAPSTAQDKKEIKSIDDVPRFSYLSEATATDVFSSEQKLKELSAKVQTDYQNLLEQYIIEDKTIIKEVLSTLKNIDLHNGDMEGAMAKVEKIRALQEKPADKLLSGLSNMAYIKAKKDTHGQDEAAFKQAFKSYFNSSIAPLPWDIVQDDVESTKGSLEIYSENLILGIIKERMDPAVEKTGQMSDEIASSLISMKYLVKFILPVKQEMIAVYEDYIKANKVEKVDIWADRDINISGEEDLSKVVVAIWDSGVDMEIFKSQAYVNQKEKPDGKDTDNNGFVDDIYGIAYDLQSNKTKDVLYPLTAEQKERLPNMVDLMKGLQDLQANVSSEEASALKKKMSQIKPEEVKPFIEELSLFANYAHGTHVAGIASKGNPKALVMVSRITFDYKMIPDPPTKKLYKRFAQSAREAIIYYKQNKVRVVNMSWGETPKSIESALEANGIGENAEDRKKMAREMFDIFKTGLYEGIKGAPEILFVTAAGNSDSDSEFFEQIPSSFELPNILTVGAVDQAGEETSFTSFGDHVDVHANGFEVESYIPGGKLMKMSGTSMASPNVANLAAKLLAIDPSLTVQETINLIKNGAEVSEDQRRTLIHPKKSVKLLKNKKQLK